MGVGGQYGGSGPTPLGPASVRTVNDPALIDPSRTSQTPDLHDKLLIVRRNWWIVALTVAVAVGLSWWLTSGQQKVYQASSEVLLRTDYNATLFPFGGTGQDALLRYPDIEILFVGETEFRQTVRALQPAGVTVSTKADLGGGALGFTAQGNNPDDVALAANIWAETYLAERQADVLAENQASIDFVSASLDELDRQRSEIRADVVRLDQRLALTSDSDEFTRLLNQKLLLEENLQSDLAPVEAQIAELNAQSASLELLGRTLNDSGASARLSVPADVPSTPVSPTPSRNLATGAILGLLLGSALAYGRSALDSGLVTSSDLVDTTGLQPLASIPRYKVDSKDPIEVLVRPTSQASEGYRSLVTGLELAARSNPFASLLLASPNSKDGKSTTAVNLATLASVHIRVLVIGADLRRPSLHTLVGAANKRGLANVLSGECDFEDVVLSVGHEGGNFDLLASGPPMPDPTPLLRGDAWRVLIDKATARYDLVIVDGPPVLPVTDSLLLARHLDAQVMLVRSGTRRRDLIEAVSRAESTGTPILGAVMNQVRMTNAPGYRYDYSENRR